MQWGFVVPMVMLYWRIKENTPYWIMVLLAMLMLSIRAY